MEGRQGIVKRARFLSGACTSRAASRTIAERVGKVGEYRRPRSVRPEELCGLDNKDDTHRGKRPVLGEQADHQLVRLLLHLLVVLDAHRDCAEADT